MMDDKMDYVADISNNNYFHQGDDDRNNYNFYANICQTATLPTLPPTKQRYQANARERYRTHSVNSAFSALRLLIPTEPKNRKLSKIETLRLAKSYIGHLAAILMTGNNKQPCLDINCTDLYYNVEDSTMETRTNICTFCVASKNN